MRERGRDLFSTDFLFPFVHVMHLGLGLLYVFRLFFSKLPGSRTGNSIGEPTRSIRDVTGWK
jgi:hypothetical protein